MAESKPPRDLPQVPDSVDPAIRRPLSRVIEEVQRLLEFRGDPLDAALTTRKAIARGLMDSLGRALVGNVTYVNTFPSSGGGGGGGDAPDLTPPPDVTGLSVVAGFTQVLVEFDAPVYTQGHGNLQTNIYASRKDPADPTLPTFGDAVLVFSAPGALNVVSIPSELNTRWHIWAKYKTVDGVESVTAAGGANGYNVAGVYPTTGQDIQQLMEVLTGQIRESHLYRALGDPIRSIIERSDAAAEDTVAALVAAHESGRRARTALLAEAAARGTAITEVRRVVATGDAQLASQITTLTAAVNTDRSNTAAALELEAEARANADEAEATERSTLATQLRGGYTGTDVASVTSGLVFSERHARSTVDAAHAERLDSLEASVDDPSTGLLARANILETRTTAAGSGNAALASRALALEVSVNTPTTGLLARAGALETNLAEANDEIGAVAARTTTLEARVTEPSTDPGDPAFNTTYAELQTEKTARADLDGAVQALYTVRAEVSAGGRTVAGGFGLAGTASATEGPRIDFGVRADRFWVGAPDDGSAPGIGDVQPFFIQTAPTTINGVAVPAGTYIADAFIRNGTITNVKIANAAIDDAKVANLSAAKLTAGSIAVGAHIQSTGYVSGTSGWRIHGNGTAEFSGVIVRGTVYATAGQIGGNTIDATGVQSPGYSAPTSGWRLDSSGVVRAFASGGARVLDMAATGTQPVLKIGSALELLANGDAFFGGRLAVGAVTAAASVIATGSNVFIPNSSPAEINTGTIATHTSTGIAAFFSIAAEVQIFITSASVAFVSIGIAIKRDGATIAIKRDIIEKRQVAIFPANWKTIPVSFRHTQPAGAENYTATIDIISMDSSGAAVLPEAGSTISYNIDGWILENKV